MECVHTPYPKGYFVSKIIAQGYNFIQEHIREFALERGKEELKMKSNLFMLLNFLKNRIG